jgi:hypothetical protein
MQHKIFKALYEMSVNGVTFFIAQYMLYTVQAGFACRMVFAEGLHLGQNDVRFYALQFYEMFPPAGAAKYGTQMHLVGHHSGQNYGSFNSVQYTP